jgi:hypothetical protein
MVQVNVPQYESDRVSQSCKLRAPNGLELQAAGAERAEVTLEGLIAEASEIKNKAMARGNYSAAVSALVMKAKLSGHWLDRTENKTSNVIYHISDEPLSVEEWEEKWCK